MLLRGSRGTGRVLRPGLWDSPDLVAVIRVAARNAVPDRPRRRSRRHVPLWAPRSVSALATPHARSRRDIAAHYDLGNELFERMLDATMMYSCALFARPGMTLAEASGGQARARL